MPWCIISWGTKFFIDALLFQGRDEKELHREFAWPLSTPCEAVE
jgi:hypothetical protein